MEEIRPGMATGLTHEQIELYAETKSHFLPTRFNYLQMQELRKSLESGTSIEDVRKQAIATKIEPAFK